MQVVTSYCYPYVIPMREKSDPGGDYNKLFIERTGALRRLRGFTQSDMAKLLDIPLYRYKKYETRSPLPHYLLERFSLLTQVSLEALITGRNRESSRKIA